MPEISSREVVYSTPWFELIAKTVKDNLHSDIYYSLQPPDYVSVLALTDLNQVLLVSQYRPAPEAYSLELPSGHVDPGETPAEAARRELAEETGYEAGPLELLGCLVPDSGRLSNRLWCFFTSGATLCHPAHPPETGIELVKYTLPQLLEEITHDHFIHALHLAIVMLAVSKQKLSMPVAGGS